jgi:hypothetical protein
MPAKVSSIKTPYYSLNIKSSAKNWVINGSLFDVPDNTCHLPHTFDLLAQELPCILSATCFNPKNLPFSIELKQTEVGHLLEHILLEYLCEEKINFGACNSATFDGFTTWYVDDPSEFKITIEKTAKDNIYFIRALNQSVSLLTKIFSYHELDTPYDVSTFINTTSPNFAYNYTPSRLHQQSLLSVSQIKHR